MAFARTGEVPIYYEESGMGHPVILIHGHGADSRMWERQVDALEEARFRAVRYDLRGHGRSEKPEGGYTWRHHVDDLRALIGNIGVGPVHLVGLSMGAGVALAYALARPDRVSALVLMAPAVPGFTYSTEFSDTVAALRDAFRREGKEALERLWLDHPIFATLRQYPDAFERLRLMVRAYSAADYVVDEEAETPAVLDRLGEIRLPTLVIVGEKDLPDFLLMADLLAENITAAQKVVIPDAGHVVNMEKPDEVNRALLDFFARIGVGLRR